MGSRKSKVEVPSGEADSIAAATSTEEKKTSSTFTSMFSSPTKSDKKTNAESAVVALEGQSDEAQKSSLGKLSSAFASVASSTASAATSAASAASSAASAASSAASAASMSIASPRGNTQSEKLDPSTADSICLLVKEIICTKLKNVEMMGGKNDVFVMFEWRGGDDKTKVMDNSGETASFFYQVLRVRPFNKDTKPLVVKVYDDNATRSDVLIGKAEIDISQNKAGSAWTAEFDVANDKGEVTGHLKVDLALENIPWDIMDEHYLFEKNKSLLGSMSLSPVTFNRHAGKFNKPLIENLNYERENKILSIASAGLFATWFLFSAFKFLIFFFYLIMGNCKWTLSGIIFHNTIQFCVVAFLFSIVAHRVIAYVGGTFLRYFLNNYDQGALFDTNGVYDIHFSWLSIRGFFDRVEIVVYNTTLRNPPHFRETPYVAYIKEIRIVAKTSKLLKLIKEPLWIRLEEVIVDGLELYVEKIEPQGSYKGELNNLFYAITVPEKPGAASNHAEPQHQKTDNTITTASLPTEGAVPSDKQLFPNLPERQTDPSKKKSTDFVSDFLKRFATKVQEKFTGTSINIPSVSVPNMGTKKEAVQELPKTDVPPAPADITKPMKFDIGRLQLYNVKAHILDFLSLKHMEPTESSDIVLPTFTLEHEKLTDKPHRLGAPREGLTIFSLWEQKIESPLISAVVSSNSLALPTLIAKLSANRTSAAAAAAGNMMTFGVFSKDKDQKGSPEADIADATK